MENEYQAMISTSSWKLKMPSGCAMKSSYAHYRERSSKSTDDSSKKKSFRVPKCP